jgi:hypothetical protein
MKPKARSEDIVRLHQEGLSVRQIADRLGVSKSAISLRMKALGLKSRGKSTSAEWNSRKAEVEYLYHVRRLSQEQIAAYYGVTQAVIYKVMKRLCIQRRSKGRRGPEHHHFKDGKSSVVYRRLVVKDQCRNCEATENLSVHHKNNDHYDNRLENLEVLCESCHISLAKKAWWAAKKAGLPTPKGNGPVGWAPRRKRPDGKGRA